MQLKLNLLKQGNHETKILALPECNLPINRKTTILFPEPRGRCIGAFPYLIIPLHHPVTDRLIVKGYGGHFYP